MLLTASRAHTLHCKMPIAQTVEHHPLYGDIRITINSRARNIILRARAGIIEVTLPPRAGRADFLKALDKYGKKLLAECRENMPAKIDADYKIEKENFSFMLAAGSGSRYFIRYDGQSATLFCPATTDFSDENTQELLRRVRVTALHRVAKEQLPQRLKMLAAKHGFFYNAVSLRSSRTRWGSCSNKRNISLSIYLQLLPTHLADYVILHELCHTVEMNHGVSFWALMDKVTDGKAKLLRAELKKYKPAF